MFQSIVPSQLVRPFVPQRLDARFGGKLNRVLAIADTIWAGRDEKAESQRTAMIVFAIRIVSALIAYVSQVLIARWVGGHEYGIFVWVWTLAVILGGVACLGFPSAVVRFVPEYKLAGDASSLRGLVFSSRLYSVGAATLIAAFGMAFLWLFEEQVSSIYWLPLFLGAICLPMIALGDVQEGVARSFNWMLLALSPKFLVRPVLILAAMAAAIGFGMAPTACTALKATIFATWLTSVVQLLMIDRKFKSTVEAGPNNKQPKLWLSVALPIFLVEGFYVLLTNVDILIVGYYLPPADVAVYFAAVKTLALVHFVYYAVRATAAHRYSHFHHAGDKAAFASYVRDTVQWTFWPSVAMGAFIVAIGQFLLTLFGEGFDAGYPLLFILVIGILARASIGPAESVLTMSGQQNVCAVIYGVALLVNIALNVTFIPKYGLYGAAWATSIAMVFEAAALYSITLRRLGLHMFVLSPSPVRTG